MKRPRKGSPDHVAEVEARGLGDLLRAVCEARAVLPVEVLGAGRHSAIVEARRAFAEGLLQRGHTIGVAALVLLVSYETAHELASPEYRAARKARAAAL